MTEDKKPFWQSSTLIFNGLTLLGIALAAVLDAEAVTDPRVLPWITVAIAVVNGALRFKTDRGVSMTDERHRRSGV